MFRPPLPNPSISYPLSRLSYLGRSRFNGALVLNFYGFSRAGSSKLRFNERREKSVLRVCRTGIEKFFFKMFLRK